MSRISQLTELTTPHDNDLLPIVDVSDTTQASSGSTKYIKVGNLPIQSGVVTDADLQAALADLLLAGTGITVAWNGTNEQWTISSTVVGTTNLAIANRGTSTLDVTSDTGTDATIPAATTSLAGLMASADKSKLDGIAAGATANSTDAQLRDRATHTGSQAISTVSGLQTALDGKAALSHTHGNITNAGAIGSTSGLPIITGSSGVLQAGSFGTASGTFAQGNDSRITNAAQVNASNTFTSSQTVANALRLSGANPEVGPSTSDGADTALLFLEGGGGFGPTTRGPHISLHGLDAVTRPGNIEFHAGVNGEIRFGGEQGGGMVIGMTVRPNGMLRFRSGIWHGDADGNQRVFYLGSSTTFHKGLGTTPHEWYNGSDATILRLGSGGELTLFGLEFHRAYTVSTLPSASANSGAVARVTDATSSTNGTTAAGGGSIVTLVQSNGTNWIIK